MSFRIGFAFWIKAVFTIQWATVKHHKSGYPFSICKKPMPIYPYYWCFLYIHIQYQSPWFYALKTSAKILFFSVISEIILYLFIFYHKILQHYNITFLGQQTTAAPELRNYGIMESRKLSFALLRQDNKTLVAPDYKTTSQRVGRQPLVALRCCAGQKTKVVRQKGGRSRLNAHGSQLTAFLYFLYSLYPFRLLPLALSLRSDSEAKKKKQKKAPRHDGRGAFYV